MPKPDFPAPSDSDSTAELRCVVPVILSGGTGARLWPLSRIDRPKQFLPLVSDRSMIQETALRVATSHGFAAPVVVCAAAHRAAVTAQLAQVGAAPRRLLLEPLGRNTAPAIAAAAIDLARNGTAGCGGDMLMLVLPADHHVADANGLRAAIARAIPAARAGHLATFGMRPTSPETGYGYILPGAPVAGTAGPARTVARFIEKPPPAQAEAFLAGGRHLWNSGMFLFPVASLLGELHRHAPEVLAAAEAAVDRAVEEREADGRSVVFLDRTGFAAAPARSIDHAVMEKTDRAVVVPAAIGWTDVGSWSSLWEIGRRDAEDNVVDDAAVAIDTRGCLVRTDGIPTAAIGVEDLVIVGSRDGILVARRDRVQEVRVAAARLDGDRSAADATGRGHRLRTVTIDPGAMRRIAAPEGRCLSLTIVEGQGRLSDETGSRPCHAGAVMAVPAGAAVTLDNPSDRPMTLIEIAIEAPSATQPS